MEGHDEAVDDGRVQWRDAYKQRSGERQSVYLLGHSCRQRDKCSALCTKILNFECEVYSGSIFKLYTIHVSLVSQLGFHSCCIPPDVSLDYLLLLLIPFDHILLHSINSG